MASSSNSPPAPTITTLLSVKSSTMALLAVSPPLTSIEENVDALETFKVSKVGVSETVIVPMPVPSIPVAVTLLPLMSRVVTVPNVPTSVPSSRRKIELSPPIDPRSPQSHPPEPSAMGI